MFPAPQTAASAKVQECVPEATSFSNQSQPSLAVLSIGSNIQPRFHHINYALRLLESNPKQVRILDSSFMYDTTPMYVSDQARFANIALLVCLTSFPSLFLDL